MKSCDAIRQTHAKQSRDQCRLCFLVAVVRWLFEMCDSSGGCMLTSSSLNKYINKEINRKDKEIASCG